MNWDNQNNKDPWGNNNNDAADFDELIKKFSSIFGGGNKQSNGSSSGGDFKMPTKKLFSYGFFAAAVIYGSLCVYQLDSSEQSVVLRFGEYHKTSEEGLNFMLAGVDERYIENVTLTRRYSQSANMLTKDENIVDVTVSAQYRIANLKDFILNADGRCDKPILENDLFKSGKYEIKFYCGEYFKNFTKLSKVPFLDDVVIRFGISDINEHYHVPLLISPWSYTTYRGS